MELRWTLAVVAPAGAGVGREVALQLARAGAAVLVVDTDERAADAAAALLAPARTRCWTLRADVRDADDSALVARRARDLGGADVVVTTGTSGPGLGLLVAADADVRRGPRSGQPVAVVHVVTPDARTPPDRLGGALLVEEVPAEPGRTASVVLARLRRL